MKVFDNYTITILHKTIKHIYIMQERTGKYLGNHFETLLNIIITYVQKTWHLVSRGPCFCLGASLKFGSHMVRFWSQRVNYKRQNKDLQRPRDYVFCRYDYQCTYVLYILYKYLFSIEINNIHSVAKLKSSLLYVQYSILKSHYCILLY